MFVVVVVVVADKDCGGSGRDWRRHGWYGFVKVRPVIPSSPALLPQGEGGKNLFQGSKGTNLSDRAFGAVLAVSHLILF